MAVDLAARQAVRRRLLQRSADVLALIPEAAAERFGLGAVVGVPERRHGGVNSLWRVRTDQGEFAVHAMHGGPAIVDRLDAVLALEAAASAAGVPLAPPVPDPRTGRAALVFDDRPVVVHEWVDAEPVRPDGSPPDLYGRLGGAIGLLHGLDGVEPPAGRLSTHPDEAGWRALAADARSASLPWADDLAAGAADLATAAQVLDGWDRDADEPDVVGHRDLTSMNVLGLDGTPVLIDWEDAGVIAAGDELGRTALDNLARSHGVLDDELLATFLRGYAEVAPIPPVGPHWCSLWIRGLLAFTAHCARSCIEGTADESLLRLQSEVVAWAVPDCRRRLDAVPTYVAAFERASRSSS